MLKVGGKRVIRGIKVLREQWIHETGQDRIIDTVFRFLYAWIDGLVELALRYELSWLDESLGQGCGSY